ncbi:MAG: DEAD/DEAH box helicase family protein [Caulobacter sp.]
MSPFETSTTPTCPIRRGTGPKRAETQINQRLSLRKPQSESLHRLADIVDLIAPSKDTDVEAAREAVRSVYGNLDDADFEDFERDFPSVCFALATGVGKTRLLGAFVSYLFMTGKSRNFFVLAPNLTIYEKLLADFQPSSPKYVFKGVEAFAHQPPLIVNAENYEEGRGVRGAEQTRWTNWSAPLASLAACCPLSRRSTGADAHFGSNVRAALINGSLT